MKDTYFLIVNKNRVVSMSKTYPSLKPDERCFKFDISIPNSLFTKTEYEAKLEITEKDLKEKINEFEIEFNRIKNNE